MIRYKYIHPEIEICKTCSGTGDITIYPEWDLLNHHGEAAKCTTCEGSGRVLVSKKIEVTVEPFKKQNI